MLRSVWSAAIAELLVLMLVIMCPLGNKDTKRRTLPDFYTGDDGSASCYSALERLGAKPVMSISNLAAIACDLLNGAGAN